MGEILFYFILFYVGDVWGGCFTLTRILVLTKDGSLCVKFLIMRNLMYNATYNHYNHLWWHILYFSHFQNLKFVNSAMWTHQGVNWFFPFKPNFCNFFEFSVTKSTQKSINIVHTLALKIVKWSLLNLKWQGLSKNAPKFQYSFQFQFYLVFVEKMIQ